MAAPSAIANVSYMRAACKCEIYFHEICFRFYKSNQPPLAIVLKSPLRILSLLFGEQVPLTEVPLGLLAVLIGLVVACHPADQAAKEAVPDAEATALCSSGWPLHSAGTFLLKGDGV